MKLLFYSVSVRNDYHNNETLNIYVVIFNDRPTANIVAICMRNIKTYVLEYTVVF